MAPRGAGARLPAGLLLATVSLPAAAVPFPTAGLVFVDADGDGQSSANERGLPSVVISDGTRVLKTDAEGAFAFQADIDPMLQEGEKPIVTLSTPDGYACTTPWFFRLNGDRAQDAAIRFGVKREVQTRPFEFLHVTDVHWIPDTNFYSTFIREVTAVPGRYRFAISTGDGSSCDHVSPELAWQLSVGSFEMMSRLQMPWRIAPGNHEAIGGEHAISVGWRSDHPRYGYGLFWELYGPLRWSFTYAGVHFAGIDVMDHPSHNFWNYGSSKSAIAWLRRDLATLPAGMPVYLFGHCFNDDTLPLLTNANFRAVIYGDGHENRLAEYRGVPFVESGSLCPTAPAEYRGYRVFRVNTDGGFDENFRFPGRDAALCLFPRDFQIGPQPPTLLRMPGYGYGLPIATGAVTVTVDGQPADFRVDRTLAFRTEFTARIDLARLPCGYLKAEARAAHAGREIRSDEQLVLNIQGIHTPWRDPGKVTLRLVTCGLSAPAEVWVNGKKLDTIKNPADSANLPGKHVARRFAFELPAGLARRMNAVEVKPGLTAGKPDPVCLDYCWMEHDEEVCRDMDPRLGYGHFYGALRTHYIDLKTPLVAGREQYLRHMEANSEP
jgi:3',5'-cyclic-AMP phosphodiesterase